MKFPIKRVIGIILTIIVAAIIFYKIDFSKTFAAFSNFQWKYMFFITPLYFLSYVFKSIRWKIILNDNSCKLSDLLGIIYIGFIVNVFIPARAGDIYRGYLLNKTQNVKFLTSLGSIVFERILDGIILFLMLLTVVCAFYANDWTIKLSITTGIIFIASLSVVYFMAKENQPDNVLTRFFKERFKNKAEKFKHYIEAFKEGIQTINKPKLLFSSAFFTFLMWLTESVVMIFIFKSFNINLGLIPSIFVLSVIIFTSMIPAGSLFIGTFQCGYILALSIFNISKENALAISIVNQMITLGIIFLASLYYFYKYRNEILAIKSSTNNKD